MDVLANSELCEEFEVRRFVGGPSNVPDKRRTRMFHGERTELHKKNIGVKLGDILQKESVLERRCPLYPQIVPAPSFFRL